MGFNTETAVNWIKAAAKILQEHRLELIKLDQAIGDGDHGENMDRGFTAAVEKLETDAANLTTPGDVFKTVAMTLISTVGGAAGPLYGTAFLRMATHVGTKTELDLTDLANALSAGLGGIVMRGKAEVGEKTMVDAWTPAVAAAKTAAAKEVSLAEFFAEVAAAAASGAQATEPLVATKGRASYLGERSAGHLDPGAQSTALIFAAAQEAVG